ncbi:MAG TPA: beta-ketoacyl synthase chain length factor [Steroidobacteraceae bacterium]|nr:beta-ketoacyl synthase chain length factor [Steroidobacteraceae bacterium]
MNEAFVTGIGLVAPGLPSWQEAAPTLNGARSYEAAPIGTVQSELLPANERRRAPLGVRMALRAAQEATAAADATAALASVFASSDADIEIIHRICTALAEPTRSVSPTDFHNSVHNAASGYWSIATRAHGPSSAVSAYDFNLAAGLREALALLSIDDTDVLLVLYDVPPPPPLFAARPLAHPAAVALLLTRARASGSIARLALCEAREEATMHDPKLEALRQANPAMRALPLLQAFAASRPACIGVREYDDRCLGIRINTP